MHREYRPEELDHPDGGLAVVPVDRDRGLAGDLGLYAFTALLGALLATELLLGLTGWESRRLPFSITPVLAAAILGAVYIVYGALRGLLHGRVGADLALAQAALAALVLGQPFVAAEVVFIALLGEVLEAWTFSHTRRALGRLVDQSPRRARVRRDGQEIEIAANELRVGDRVIVRPGERVPVDGTVVAGRSSVDQSALTGESLPVDKGPADAVFTSTLNQFGVLEVEAEKVGAETTFGQVLRLVSEARRRKASLEKLADRLARYFLPVVEVAAGMTLLIGYLAGWPDVWSRTVAVLVVACPCSLVLATPAAMLASMAWLARHGILIKRGAALERLAACDTFAFDKTGTLTQGTPQFASIVTAPGHDQVDVLRLAASAESASHHPLARVIVSEARRRALALVEARDASILPGAGVQARCGRDDEPQAIVRVGNRRFLAEAEISLDAATEKILDDLDREGQTSLIVAVDGAIAGVIGVRDAVRPEAHDVIHDLRHLKIKEIAVLTGDRRPAAQAVAKRIHADTVEAELLPADKARWIEERRQSGRRVAMVGDGINDAPALAGADVGIALGGIGADLAAEAGDLVLLGEPLRVLPELVQLARATVRVIRQNIIGFAFGLNALAMLSATFGLLGPVAAAILHQAGSLVVLLNSMRLLVFGDWASLPPLRQLRDLGAYIRRIDDRIDLDRAWKWAWAHRRAAVGIVSLLTLLGYAVSGWTAIAPGDVGVLQRFGRFEGVLRPGLHLRWPYPIESVTAIAPERVRSIEIGFRSTGMAEADPTRWESTHGRPQGGSADGAALLLTGDGRYVELSATVQFAIDAASPAALRRFVFDVADGENALRPVAESVVREIVGRRALLDLLTRDRDDAELAAALLLAERVSAYRLGVVVRAIAFQDIHPPLEVIDAYRDVSRAASDRQRRINEAIAYRDQTVTEAKGKAEAIVQSALGEQSRRVALAGAAADSFNALELARQADPALTDLRLFWEKLAESLGGKKKVVLDEEPGRRRHLIVPNLAWEAALPVLRTDRPDEKAAPGARQQNGNTPSKP
ncbi:MAG: FtsH protease activity modulator HflK [Isosphaeraceae bacterium]